MSVPKLGKLERIESLKEIWEHEATSFTPWLAQEENIELLAQAIGRDELIVEAQEKSVGPFRADILCKDPSTDTYVLIENQLERTDHGHLGQLLTYAAGLGACTIVWIAKTFTSEHRAALDWLNEITDERFHFFGLEIEVWRIGNSVAAPKFNVTSKPNDWTRQVQEAAKEVESQRWTDRDLLLRDFWTELRHDLERNRCQVKTQKPLPQGWTNAALGRSGVYLVAVARPKKGSMGVHVVLHGPNRLHFFDQLVADQEIIERETGFAMEWLKMEDDKQESHIKVTTQTGDLVDRKKWPELIKWMREHLERMHAVFRPRVRSMTTYQQD